jgi:hypothetical protein
MAELLAPKSAAENGDEKKNRAGCATMVISLGIYRDL